MAGYKHMQCLTEHAFPHLSEHWTSFQAFCRYVNISSHEGDVRNTQVPTCPISGIAQVLGEGAGFVLPLPFRARAVVVVRVHVVVVGEQTLRQKTILYCMSIMSTSLYICFYFPHWWGQLPQQTVSHSFLGKPTIGDQMILLFCMFVYCLFTIYACLFFKLVSRFLLLLSCQMTTLSKFP